MIVAAMYTHSLSPKHHEYIINPLTVQNALFVSENNFQIIQTGKSI